MSEPVKMTQKEIKSKLIEFIMRPELFFKEARVYMNPDKTFRIKCSGEAILPEIEPGKNNNMKIIKP